MFRNNSLSDASASGGGGGEVILAADEINQGGGGAGSAGGGGCKGVYTEKFGCVVDEAMAMEAPQEAAQTEEVLY
jgi:hypothetical protein